MDIGQVAAIMAVGWFIIELFRRIILFIWEEIRPAKKQFYGPTHKQYYTYREALKKRNG
jgi:hypothetical protein